MVWGNLIAAGGAIAGGIAGSRQGEKDARIANQRFQQGIGSYDAGIAAYQGKFAQAEPYIQQMLQTALAGLQEQRALTSDIGQYGYMQIKDALSSGTGALTRNFGARGLAGSSTHYNAQRGLQADAARGFGNLTSQLASVRSQTVRAALGDLMQAQSGAAGFYEGSGARLASLHSQKGQAILSVGHQPAQGVGAGYGTAASFLGRALDDFIGGGGGPAVDVGVAPGEMGPGLEHMN